MMMDDHISKIKKNSQLPFGDWKDCISFIVGGGPSLKKEMHQLPRLHNVGKVIVTNNAYKLLPNAEILHFADDIWYSWHEKSISEIFRGSYVTTAAAGSPPIKWNRKGIYHFKKTSNNGISTTTSCLAGSNSGHQAINLAIHMGSKKIVLLGFDMDVNSTETNWHSEHKRPTNRNSYKDVMIPGMLKSLSVLEKMNIEIVNTSIASKLDCFPKIELEDFLRNHEKK